MTSQTALHRTISFEANARLAPPVSSYDPAMSNTKSGRRRRSSSIIYQEPPESLEQISDQSALPNLNSQWVNAKGAPRSRTQRVEGINERLTCCSHRSLDDTPCHNHRPQDSLRRHSWRNTRNIMDLDEHHLHGGLVSDVSLGSRCAL
jgi:hypothetical protein